MNKRINIDACLHVYKLLEEGNLAIWVDGVDDDPIYNIAEVSVILKDNKSIKTKIDYCPICGQKIVIKEGINNED